MLKVKACRRMVRRCNKFFWSCVEVTYFNFAFNML